MLTKLGENHSFLHWVKTHGSRSAGGGTGPCSGEPCGCSSRGACACRRAAPQQRQCDSTRRADPLGRIGSTSWQRGQPGVCLSSKRRRCTEGLCLRGPIFWGSSDRGPLRQLSPLYVGCARDAICMASCSIPHRVADERVARCVSTGRFGYLLHQRVRKCAGLLGSRSN